MKEGWTYKKLGEVGITQTGTTPSKSNSENYGGNIPFIRPAEIPADGSGCIIYDTEIKLSEEGVKSGRLFKSGSILMVCIGSIGKLGYLDRDASCNQQINILTPHNDYNSKFVFYAMSSSSFQKESLKIAQGAQATLPIINKSKWTNLTIPIAPLPTQQRIVSYLDSAFAQIDELKAKAEKQLSEAKALFQKALSKAMEPKEGWEENKLEEVCYKIVDGTHHSPTNTLQGDFPYITAKNIRIEGIDLSNVTYVTKEVHKDIFERCNPEMGDVLLIKDGATTGIAVVNTLNFEFSLLSSVALLKPDKCLIESRYLCYLLNSPNVYAQFRSKMDGAAITRITLRKIKDATILLPPTKRDQHRIVTYLDALSAKVKSLEANLNKVTAECAALKQSILRQVFE